MVILTPPFLTGSHFGTGKRDLASGTMEKREQTNTNKNVGWIKLGVSNMSEKKCSICGDMGEVYDHEDQPRVCEDCFDMLSDPCERAEYLYADVEDQSGRIDARGFESDRDYRQWSEKQR